MIRNVYDKVVDTYKGRLVRVLLNEELVLEQGKNCSYLISESSEDVTRFKLKELPIAFMRKLKVSESESEDDYIIMTSANPFNNGDFPLPGDIRVSAKHVRGLELVL